jgi:nucleotide-binding universal stress UspA family protein
MNLFRKLLVSLDGSSFSEAAIQAAAPLVGHSPQPVELLRLVPPLPLSSPLRPMRAGQGLQIEESLVAARSYLERLAAAAAEEHAGQGVEFTVHAGVGDPACGILDRASEVEPSLLVMSTHGRSGLTRWIRGSVAEKVLRQTRVPLYLVRPEAAGRPVKRVLVPLDGSEASAKIIPLVQDLCGVLDAEAVLFHAGILEGAELTESATGGVTRVTEELIREGLEPYREELSAGGISVRTCVAFGEPAEEILRAIEKEQIDLIATTSRGRSGLDRWAFGSVTEKVLRNCKTPLLLLPLRD